MDAPAHLHWDADALWQSLAPLLPQVTVEVLAHCESTNTKLLDRARAAAGDPDAPVTRPGQFDPLERRGGTPHGRRAEDMAPCLLVAERQTRGRGRLGRDWQSSAGASLTFSLALPLAPTDWSGLSLAVGLALAEALDPAAEGAQAPQPRLGLKWPNDLGVVDADSRFRKVGGILIETVTVGRHRMCVIGIGLNVLPQRFDGLSQPAACLQELDAAISAPQALARVAAPLVRAVKRFEREGFGPCVERYARRDVLRGQRVTTTALGLDDGIADGVDASGALRVRPEPGAPAIRVVSGEVSVRLTPAAGPAASAG
jgi:BirA family biotin operon repressor/biotin-[acetyl-CoA-carboxylase] ligase